MGKIAALPACAFAAFVLATSSAGATEPDDAAVPVSAVLCDSAVHAMQFADVMAQGEMEEIAQDRVGKAARAQVCGHYSGVAAIESETVRLKDGVAYKITGFRFREDGRVAWLAELSFAPGKAAWDL